MLTRPDASQVTYRGRHLNGRLDDFVSVKDFGAVGDGVTDDTLAIQAAVAFALAEGTKRLFFARGNYLHSGVLATLTSSDWEIAGEGKTNTVLTQAADTDSFRIDVSAANLYRIVFRDMELFNSHATGLNASGIRVVASPTSAAGLKHPTFENLRFRGQGFAGIYYEAPGNLNDGGGSISVSPHSFGMFLDLEFPQYTRYPLACVGFEGGNGPHQLFHGGQYRADPTAGYGIKAGTGGVDVSVGDMIVNGVHFVLGSAAVNLAGPSNDCYRSSVCITGCQFDAMTNNSVVLSRLERFHVFGNNYMTGVPASIVGLDFSESIFEGKDHLYLRGAIVDTVAATASRVGLAPGATTAAPRVYANSIVTDMDLSVEGQGAGGVWLAKNRPNYIYAAGSAAAVELVTITAQGADTNIALKLSGKGTKGVIVGDSIAKTVGFYNNAGAAQQTVAAAATDATTTQALANSLRAALVALGLVA